MWNTNTLHRVGPGVLWLLSAMLIQARGITDVASGADGIVVGSITTRIEGVDRVSFDVDVQRVVKGGTVPRVVHVDHAWARKGLVFPNTATTFSATFFGVWALQRTNSSS